MSPKLEMDMPYEKRSTPTMVTWHNSCVTSKKSCISVFSWLMTTMMAYGIGLPFTKLHDSSITRLYVVLWQIKNSLSPIPQVLRIPNLTG